MTNYNKLASDMVIDLEDEIERLTERVSELEEENNNLQSEIDALNQK